MKFLSQLANSAMRFYLATPAPLRWLLWLIPIVYFILPFDFDRLGLFGRIDDILFMLFCYWAFDRAKQFQGFFDEAKSFGKQQRANAKKGSSSPEPEAPFDQDPFAALGLKPGASPEEIKRAYRHLITLYHPDKFAHLGPEFEHTAQRRTQAIIAAFNRLKR